MPECCEMTGAESIRLALDLALEKDASVYLMGEGVTDPKGIFGTTVGLREKYGSKRVIETPISENAFTGIAIGSAMLGQRPVVVHQRVEFVLLALEQIVNNAAKTHYVSDGVHACPLVIRLIVGRGWGQGPLHSQSLETIFAYIPGLKVVMPSTAEDSKGMLLSAIEDENPVIFLEHRWTHYVKGSVPAGYVNCPLDGPRLMREGNSVTVVASSYMFLETLHAVDVLREEGCFVDLFDLRVVRPLNLETIKMSVAKTGTLLVIDTGWKILGPGAEIVSRIAEESFGVLRKAPRRLGLPDHPTPSSISLASAYYSTTEHIAEAICELASLEKKFTNRVKELLSKSRRSQPIDVPHETFKGPF